VGTEVPDPPEFGAGVFCPPPEGVAFCPPPPADVFVVGVGLGVGWVSDTPPVTESWPGGRGVGDLVAVAVGFRVPAMVGTVPVAVPVQPVA